MNFKDTFKSKNLLGVLAFSLVSSSINSAVAQVIFYNNGGQVYTAPSSILQINGGLQNDGGTALLEYNGTMTIANSGTPGSIFLTNSSVTQGNGTYLLEQDWVNDAVFIAGNSKVELYGSTATQFITSSNNTSTSFNDLKLSGTGTGSARIKRMALDATVSNNLVLDDRELATDDNIMFVTNTAVTAVTNNSTPGNEGFVSSIGNGSLSWQLLKNTTYLYPTGSSLISSRYRPVELTPDNPATFTVRMANNDATLDGFNRTLTDSSVCFTNPNYYHWIKRTAGAAFADVTLSFDPATDGSWYGMANWYPDKWRDVSNTVTATIGTLSAVKRPFWQTFLGSPNDPFILAEVRPATPVVTGDQVFCSNNPVTTYTASGNPNDTYSWTIVGGGTITSDPTQQTITVNWNNNTSGSISVVENSITNACPSALSTPLDITPTALPIVGFNTISSGPLSQLVSFIDTSEGAIDWYWDFGNGHTSTQQNPGQNFKDPGTYSIMLVVENTEGCQDTAYGEIKITEGVLVPNVFSPNGDGVNDQFYIPNAGLTEFNFQVFNRWGTMIWETNTPEIRWDGRTTAGVIIANGTYYYVLKALSDTNDYSQTGFITVFK